MFRTPREHPALPPSLGRAPTPPPSSRTSTSTSSSSPLPASAHASASASTTQRLRPQQTTFPAAATSGKMAASPAAVSKRQNGSILSFFKKEGKGLFVADGGRFNESEAAVKRRRVDLEEEGGDGDGVVLLDGGPGCSPPPETAFESEPTVATGDVEERGEKGRKRVGPFWEAEESDEGEEEGGLMADVEADGREVEEERVTNEEAEETAEDGNEEEQDQKSTFFPPGLKHEATSYGEQDGFADFEGMEDFEDDEFPEYGEEYMVRRYMQEQRRLEMAEEGFEGDLEVGEFEMPMQDDADGDGANVQAVSDAPTCPICSASLEGVSDQDASVHVNNCLDGNPTPLPNKKPQPETEVEKDTTRKDSGQELTSGASKFKRPTRPAKPGQENPISLGSSTGTTSAFSKLMSGHAEDIAWATAAESENASRGKPAWQRTCPFYKILPGFSICVDAFRYGAVQGCNAYFLSHFHSDHYIGLTASWSHGPIYCSRPTANLVRQQLRVDPHWVVDVEFEKKFTVPGTDGVCVTMIPANHCPGSSIFLFEKTTGKGKSPKVQRVLHCGDFRACPAHVEHPLLRPTVQDVVTGVTSQQKIDVCYLDTTYLNPKFSFPSQEDVIQACADMCVQLDKPPSDATVDAFDQLQPTGGNTTNGMDSFVHRDSTATPTLSKSTTTSGRLLVVVGTYSIGKERICLGIARALNSLIYAPPAKQRICACLEDPELSRRLTSDPFAAQVHMTPLFEIRAETLSDYLAAHSSRFSRAVGFRPSGWTYRPPGGRAVDNPPVTNVLHSGSWQSAFTSRDLVPQRGSGAKSKVFGVPYSEHSSFRELTMFCCALRIDKIIPTVNVGSAKSRERMKLWCDRWAVERRKNGLFVPAEIGVDVGEEVEVEEVQEKKKRSKWFAGKGTTELRTTL